jgi:hypothetical protein
MHLDQTAESTSLPKLLTCGIVEEDPQINREVACSQV